MKDSLQRFLFEHVPVRGELVHLDATWHAVLERHDYPEPLRKVLGELMAAAALLAATLKFEGSIILQLHGSGPVTLIVVECTSEQTLRATAKWNGELQGDDLPALLGTGRFVITLSPTSGKQTYQGVVDLEGRTVAACLEHYMGHSEQLQTRLWLASDDARAAGMLLQQTPGRCDDDTDGWTRVCHLGNTLTATELLDLPPEVLLHRLYHEDDVRIFEPRPVSFRCSCSTQRVVSMLRMLGRDEVRSIVAERNTVDVTCDFCNKRYSFDAVDAEQVFAGEAIAVAGRTRH
ncbi:MAG: Hsp33 family molecular chaperone HslO [Rhodospirillaceae bacterium]